MKTVKAVSCWHLANATETNGHSAHSPDGHDKHQHDDGNLHHAVATDANVVVNATALAVFTRRSCSTAAASLMPMMWMMMVVVTTPGTVIMAPWSRSLVVSLVRLARSARRRLAAVRPVFRPMRQTSAKRLSYPQRKCASYIGYIVRCRWHFNMKPYRHGSRV